MANTDIVFSPSVKAAQARKTATPAHERFAARGGFRDAIDEGLAAFIASRDSLYLATASATGQPYIQHRGGPPGFLRVLDARTLAFADYRGNRQYITLGNLAENPRAFIFLMDYAHRQRIKIWGHARVSEDRELIATLMPEGYEARPEQAIVFTIEAWDANCPQHIPMLLPAADVAAAIERLNARIAALESENAALKGGGLASLT